MTETENEEQLSQSSPNINSITVSELPGKSYGITIEVPLFLTILSVSLSGAAISNIILYRTCVHTLNHTEDECKFFLSPEKTNETSPLEAQVQKYATFISTVKMFLESVGPAFLSFFLGVWSDTHGRKPLVVWPLFGISISTMMTVVYSMLDSFGPWWYIVTAVPYALTGGYTVLFIGALCYLSDITTEDNRSFRMTLLQAITSVGMILGTLASSYLLKAVGTVNLLLMSAVLTVISYAFTNIWIRESLTTVVQGGLTSVLKLSLVKEMMYECFKRRPNHGRAQILLLTATNSALVFLQYGLLNLEYMYTREKLHWSMREYTKYSAANNVLSFVGSFLGVVLFQKVLHVSDIAFTFVAYVSYAGEFFIKAFATASWHIYFAAIISLFKGLAAPLIRSIITKILPAKDIATVISLMCALEGLCPLFSPAIFNVLYDYTITGFSGAIYIFSGAIAGFCVVLLVIVQYYRCMSLSAIMTVIYSMLGSFGPWWYILTAIPLSLTGGFTVLFTGAFCYLTDITTTQNRSLRMTILEAAVSVGSVLGSVASSYVLKSVGNVYLLLLVALLNTVAYAFTNIRLKESLTGAVQGGITTVLDFLLVKEMMRECFKRRPNYGRAQILLLTIANSVSIFILYGLISLEYWYTREKLHWAVKEYTIYSAASTTIAFVGSFLGVGLIQKVFRVSDLAFSIVAFTSSAAEYMIRALAVTSWHMYLGAGIALFKGLSAPLIRSLITKILPIEDIAKVFSLMCALEGICPLLSPAIYNSLYAVTITRFPGAIYILSAGIAGSCVIMLGFVQYYRHRTPTNAYRTFEAEQTLNQC